MTSFFQALRELEASLECLVDVVSQGLLGLQVNRGLLEILDPEGQRVLASKEKREMMVSTALKSLNLNVNKSEYLSFKGLGGGGRVLMGGYLNSSALGLGKTLRKHKTV
jgi:hypothetical protein